MTVVPANRLSNHDMDQLGNNILPAVKLDLHREAVNRSLAVHDEEIDLSGDGDIERACASEEIAS